MDFKIQFRSPEQEEFFFLKNRNQCNSGGFGNGKTWAACLKSFVLLSSFRRYRMLIARQLAKDLRETTMKTFFKICPEAYIESHNNQAGLTVLKNRSEVLWMHLDECDEKSLRGLEINSALIDQGEEISEAIYLVLDSRIGRWDKAEVPPEMLTEDWPLTPLGVPKLPTYMMVLCNPDTQYHWIYQRYHPDSVDRRPDHVMIQAQTVPDLNDPETIQQMLTRDPQWVRKYYKGEWGISDAQIHTVNSASLLEPTPELLELIKNKATLFRVLDHGDTAPTCCLWFAVLNRNYICYREYYQPNSVISTHRRNITELSIGETYSSNYADPAIFKKQGQRDGGFWTVADEYLTSDIDAPSLTWTPADNNELATRNRINEFLGLSPSGKHPLTGNSPAPKLYFIKKTKDYPYGCFNSIKETQSQRRMKIGDYNGMDIFSDEREDNIADHAYDCVRYFIAMHGSPNKVAPKKPTKRSFAYFDAIKNIRNAPKPLSAEF
jgi:hypothetical protein